MTPSAPLREDFIDAVFRPVIGFFAGSALGYVVQLAGVSGWPIALAYTAILGVVVVVWIWMYERLRLISDWFLEKIGIAPRVKPQLRPIPKRKKHWFVRYGWIAGIAIGVLAVMIWPDEVSSWL